MLRTRRLVLDMDDDRPVMAMPLGIEERLRATLTFGWELVRVRTPSSGRGDGVRDASPEAIDAVQDAEVYFGFGAPESIIRSGTNLRWIHSGTAGVSGAITTALRESGVVFTNSAGVHAPAVAETVIGMMLHFARGFDVAVRAQSSAEWRVEPFERAPSIARELAGATLGIFGYGGIGREVARRAVAMGMHVVAVRRRGGGPMGDEHATVLTGRDGLERMLGESDYVLLSAPETRETRGAISANAIERMKRDAVLINVARGALMNEEALLRALRDGALRGAALDVFATEPLPPSSPLWRLPNVLVTPHVSAFTARFWEREAALLLDNLRRYLKGQPLRNVVDLAAGY